MVTDPEALFTAHQHRLVRYFYRAVGHAETARDLTQDVFLRVSRSTIPDATDAEVRAWLFQIARNLALDHHRKRARHPEPLALVDDRARLPSQDVDLAVNEALAVLPDRSMTKGVRHSTSCRTTGHRRRRCCTSCSM
jgi:RNA polymerase sigma factor (sigma-70 family)